MTAATSLGISVAVEGKGKGAELVRAALRNVGCDVHPLSTFTTPPSINVVWLAEEIDSFRPYTIPTLIAQHSYAELVVSSPIPIGTTDTFPRNNAVSYVLENVRENDRLIDFPRPPFVRGLQEGNSRASPFTNKLLKLIYGGPFYETSAKEAEFIKHALNTLLATCVAFSEEIRIEGKARGNNPEAVARCLRQDPRIGSSLPILPRGRFSSHLQRDIRGLMDLPGLHPLLKAVLHYRQDP